MQQLHQSAEEMNNRTRGLYRTGKSVEKAQIKCRNCVVIDGDRVAGR